MQFTRELRDMISSTIGFRSLKYRRKTENFDNIDYSMFVF